jgi:hypothetical protein
MKISNGRQILFQGDLMVVRVRTLPQTAVRAQTNIVAHSETGHHHIAERGQVWEVPGDPLLCYLTPTGNDGIDLVHQRPWDTHETLRLLNDTPELGEVVYEIRRQREWTPEGWRRVED